MQKTISALLATFLVQATVISAQTNSIDAVDTELRRAFPDNRTVNIVFHGHSVPSGFQVTPRVKPFEAYPHLFRVLMAERYPNAVFNVITTSIGGEDAIQGAPRFATDVLPHRPDLVFIDYALNDRRNSLEDTRVAWLQMINEAREAGVPLILITPTGDANGNFTDPNNPLTQRADLVRELAEQEDVILADVSAAWQDAISPDTVGANLRSTVNHPNLAGHQVAANAIYEAYVGALGPNREVSATEFPLTSDNQRVFTTLDGLVTFTTTNGFARQGNFLGDLGGTANRVNAWDGAETLQIAMAPAAQLTGFRLRFAQAAISITGFSSDPGAVLESVNGVTGTAFFDTRTNTLVLSVPFDNPGRNVTFTNPSASLGQTLNFSFARAAGQTAIAQASFVSFQYLDRSDELAAAVVEPTIQILADRAEFPFFGLAGHTYSLMASETLREPLWENRDSVGPLSEMGLVTLVDPGPLPLQRFYRIEATLP